MKQLFFLLIALFVFQFCFSQDKSKTFHHFEIKDGEFNYDGKPFKIHSGEMHYARIPREYWRHRFQMVKAMGMNTVTTYVFWNYHETAPGVWDFKSGNKNIREYIKMAQEEGLFVILRPGPYVCAEWEFGGYPWWLQQNKKLEIRTLNLPFLDSCRTYLTKLAEQVKDLQVSEGGPIILVQAENEFGSYVAQRQDIPLETHKKYNASFINILNEVGFKGPYFTSDGSSLFKGGAVKGILPTANGEDNIDNLKKAVNEFNNNTGPYMVAEFYPGWLDHWGEPFVKVKTESTVAQTERYLQAGVNFNFYMIHGGTNFGFTAGANYDHAHHIQPDLTSYDYDAPISEAGWPTEKYNALRELMKKYEINIPDVPASPPVITFPPIQLKKTYNVLEWKNRLTPIESDSVMSFEDLGQGDGYVLYSKTFSEAANGKLKIKGLRDYATVYINGKRTGELNRQNNIYELNIFIPAKATLDILVENMGRINYGAAIINNTKGIISPPTINNVIIKGNWKMYKLPFDRVPDFNALKQKNRVGEPTVYAATFNLEKTGDTFLDMESWGKGIVLVNGINLGRYWKVGPQQTLYLPGCWLKKENNEIIIFEQLNDMPMREVRVVGSPILERQK
ncbi:MAG: beta-galactosidase [Bacteroidetes bacterium]|nr:beta-galactosidase [Bacteroidota bacterium]